ncbi:FAD/NAD(P)-binding domain-containing protein [Gyrodon lividus]|nr:FAD/NAD(P)-binding domain-containing protein [Gyrodon lividus]
MGHEVHLPTLDRLGIDDPGDVCVKEVATRWFIAFSKAARENDVSATTALFTDDGSWKDVLALTWDLRTLVGKQAVTRMLKARLAASALTNLHLHDDTFRAPVLQRPWADLVLLRVHFGFSTKVGHGTGIAYLVPLPGGDWKVYSLFTCLESLARFPEKVVRSIIGALRHSTPNHGTWAEDRKCELDFPNNDPIVVILGAGHTGLEIAARLKYLGVQALVIDKQPRVGDMWRYRYKSLCLHGTTWYNQTPYLPFPCTWPTYMPALKLADWLEAYAHFLELNVWTSSTITKTTWNEESKTWSIEVNKGTSEKRILTAQHLVFATGYGGHPVSPDIPSREIFKGTTVHSTNFTSAAEYIGKKAVVIGACNSGHDISQDFLDHGIDVTMYQRSSNYVISQKAASLLLGEDFREGFPTDLADMNNASWPGLVARLLQKRKVAEVVATVDKKLYDGLARAGFKTNLGPYDAGIVPLVFGRSGGYHLNTRTGKHIINGDIKLKQGSSIECFTEKGVKFVDGTELEADIVVFATGYGDHRDVMRDICEPQVASKVGDIWGVDEDGQLMGAWRDCGHEGLWFGIGSLSISRFYSAHLAMQIKAIEEGMLKRSEVVF